MGLRQTLKEKPIVGVTLAVVLIGVAIFMISRGAGGSMKLSEAAFFSVDDGQTVFTASRSQIAPFEHEGKQAVQVHYFSCDQGKTKFIGFLSKLTDGDKKSYEAALADAKAKGRPAPMSPQGYLVKKVGAKDWVFSMSPAAKKLTDIKCDDGFPEIVHPD